MEQLQQLLLENQDYQELLEQIHQHPEAHLDFAIQCDLIFIHEKIWLTLDNPFTSLLLEEFHKIPLGGHIRVTKPFHRLQDNFFWSYMRSDVR